MRRRPSRGAIIKAIVWKDLREFSRDRLWMILTPVAMIIFVTGFWFLPDTVEETITLGVFPPALAEVLETLAEGARSEARALEIVTFDDEDELARAVRGEPADGRTPEVSLGVAFPAGFAAAVGAGEKVAVSVYVNAAVPREIARAVSSEIREVVYAWQALAKGESPMTALPVTVLDERMMVLGEDRVGRQVPMRDRMRPLMLILILLAESLALAGLVAVEIERRTVTALLVTPARTGDVLAAKSMTGAILALGQGLFFLCATRSFGGDRLLVLVLMMLGAVMMSAVGMISGAAGRDFMSTLFYGMALIAPLMIPAFATLFPGSPSLWVRILPSHGLVAAMVDVMGYGRGWSDVAPEIGATVAWNVLLFGTALFILKRKMEAV